MVTTESSSKRATILSMITLKNLEAYKLVRFTFLIKLLRGNYRTKHLFCE